MCVCPSPSLTIPPARGVAISLHTVYVSRFLDYFLVPGMCYVCLLFVFLFCFSFALFHISFLVQSSCVVCVEFCPCVLCSMLFSVSCVCYMSCCMS